MPSGRIKNGKKINVFVDRKEARSLFAKKYADVANGENWAIINYFGIGGIGKSSVIARIIEENLLKSEGRYYVKYDFHESSKRTLDVLVELRNQLCQNYPKEFKFTRFEAGLFVYYEKNGKRSEIIEASQNWMNNSLANAVMETGEVLGNLTFDILEKVPVVNAAVHGFKTITYLANYLKEAEDRKKVSQIKQDMVYAEDQNDKFIEMIVDYFATDLSEATKELNTPLVIFVDTYEAYSKSFATDTAITADRWLYDQLVGYEDNVLWVITGREKLEWPSEILDEECKFELSELEDGFVDEYLEDAEIPGKYIEDIKKVAMGNPLWLYLISKHYYDMQAAGKEFDLSNIKSHKELVERYLRYLGDVKVDIVKEMAFLGSWNDDIRDYLGWSGSAYDEIITNSYISKVDDKYMIHDLMRETICASCRENDYSRIEKIYNDVWSFCVTKIEKNDNLIKGHYISYLIGFLSYNSIPNEKYIIKDFDLDIIIKAIEEYKKDGKYPDYYLYAQMCYEYAKKHNELSFNYFTKIEQLYAESLSKIGKYKEALNQYEIILDKRKGILGENHPDTLSAMNYIANSLYDLGQYEEALKLYEKVLDKRKQVLGEDHLDTLGAMNNIASILGCLGQYEEALKLYKEVLAKQKSVLGDNHSYMLSVMNNMASILGYLGRYEEAISLYKEVLDKRKRVLGEDHPYILSVMNNIASILNYLGRYEEALNLYEEVLDKRKRVLGEEHPDTLETKNTMSTMIENINKRE